ncbi:MAG: AAA family ATPase [Bacteroidetes bacterium]|nr:AAA family ATPase [Bacteroidota bacterium]
METLRAVTQNAALPFMGRDSELQNLVDLWRATDDAPGMLALLLSGEAGIGKSRLMEELARRVSLLRGSVIQVKLYPESSTSLVEPFVHALWQLSLNLPAARIADDRTIDAVAHAIGRVARVRRTLVVIEDVHLLAAENRADTQRLLSRLVEEQILCILTARPVELQIAPVVDDVITHRMTLRGLTAEQIHAMIANMGHITSPALARELHAVTTGNPLALRSALRSALRFGLFDAAEAGDNPGGDVAIEQMIGPAMKILSEGMIAHLLPEERIAAERLAVLGEVFAHETAAAIVDEADLLRLITKGIIAHTDTPVAALGRIRSTDPLLAYTHTLLHHYFIDRADVDADLLVRVIGTGLPLYSTQPFLLLEESRADLGPVNELIVDAIERAVDIANLLDATADWRKAQRIAACAARILRVPASTAGDPGERALRIKVLGCQLRLQRRNVFTELFSRQLNELLELTANPATPVEGADRIHALAFVYRQRDPARGESAMSPETWDEVQHIVERWSDVRYHTSHVLYLRDVAYIAEGLSDVRTLRLVENRWKEIREGVLLDDERRQIILNDMAGCMLQLFETPEEVAQRHRAVNALIAEEDRITSGTRMHIVNFMAEIGRLNEIREQTLVAARKLEEMGLPGMATNCRLLYLIGDVAAGAEMNEVRAALEALIQHSPEHLRQVFRSNCDDELALAALLRGEYRWIGEHRVRMPDTPFSAGARIVNLFLLLANEEPAERILAMAGNLEKDGFAEDDVTTFLADVLDPASTMERAAAAVRERCLRMRLRMRHMLDPLIVLHAANIAMRERGWDLAAAATLEIGSMVESIGAWFIERGLYAYVGPLLNYGAGHVDGSTLERWSEWSSKRPHVQTEPQERNAESVVKLSMFGTIEVKPPDSEAVRPRGARIRTLLGVLVADRMLKKPLTPREFQAWAAGEERDPDGARNTINVSVHRLRDLLHHDAIDTRGGKPQLDTLRVQVDLLDAHTAMNAADEAMREGLLPRANESLLEALRIANGEIPFPGLYDELFEGLREEFETRIRSLVLRLATQLEHAGDTSGAEELLRHALESMPGDEEIAERLKSILVLLGQRAEASRLNMHWEEA